MNFFFRTKESAIDIFSKIKENRFLSFLVFLFLLLAIVFVVVMCSENPEWIFNLLGVSEKEKPKREALKFLGIGMMGVILVVLMLSKKLSRFRTFQNFLIALLVLLGIVFVVVMISDKPSWSFKLLGVSGSENRKYEVLKFLGIGMGGILVALQALASHRRAKAMEDTAEHTEKGLRQERLKNAIEHLSHDKDSVRLGGAYELFHLAEDNKELRQTVLDILCAHIRQTTGEIIYRVVHRSKPSEEVQSLLTLLFVKNYKVFKSCDINLWGCWLNGADLQGARLQKAILNGAQLQGATLTEAHLQESELVQAHLQGTSLRFAHLQGAILWETYLQGAILWETYLQGANLWGTYLQGADLEGARLQGADLFRAQLQGANLLGTLLLGVVSGDQEAENIPISPAAYISKAQIWKSLRKPRFAARMKKSIDQESDLSGAIFEGGLSREDVDFLVEGLSDEKANELREELEPHIDQPASNELPEDSGAITGAYTKEKAKEWIAEHEEALREVSRGDS